MHRHRSLNSLESYEKQGMESSKPMENRAKGDPGALRAAFGAPLGARSVKRRTLREEINDILMP